MDGSRSAKTFKSPTSAQKASPIPESPVLHVDQLSRNINENHLKEIFGNFGEVVNVWLAIDHAYLLVENNFLHLEGDFMDQEGDLQEENEILHPHLVVDLILLLTDTATPLLSGEGPHLLAAGRLPLLLDDTGHHLGHLQDEYVVVLFW